MPRGFGSVQRKILLLLMGGVALGLSGSPGRYFRILKVIGREWSAVDKDALKKSIRSLYESRMIETHDNRDGSVTIILSKRGKNAAKILTYNLDTIRIMKPRRWDRKWRMVIFDIPHERRKARDAFRFHLYRLGLYPLQKSVFIYPYACDDEINFLVEFYDVRRYVRQIVAEDIDNEFHLKEIFKNILV